jgi:hypothetical protein
MEAEAGLYDFDLMRFPGQRLIRRFFTDARCDFLSRSKAGRKIA